MYLKTTVILILSTLAILNNVNSGNTTTVESSGAREEDANSLVPITWQEALPVVLFETSDRFFHRYPAALKKVEINREGRLVTGTEFIRPLEEVNLYTVTSSPPTQTLLCPNLNTNNNCLVPVEFEKSQILQCQIEPTPVLEVIPRKPGCGLSKSGTMMRFIYRICPPKEPYKFASRSIIIYSFCYNDNSNEISYVDYNLSSVNLLFEKLLKREHEIESELRKDTYRIINPQYFTSLDNTKNMKHQYEFQKLVPADHMALATRRKITYQYVNNAFQHKDLLQLWNEINFHIKNEALQSANSSRRIMTGVFDIPSKRLPTPADTNQMYNIWITIVDNTNEDQMNGKIILTPTEGIAILMNNFMRDKSTSKKQFIDEICGTNLCTDILTEKFTAVGGEVRCCAMTPRISDFFGIVYRKMNLLEIRNITNT